MGYIGLYRPNGYGFWSVLFRRERGIDSDHFSLKYGMLFIPVWLWILCLQGAIFLRITSSPSQMFTEIETISGYGCGNLKPSTNYFRGLKWRTHS